MRNSERERRHRDHGGSEGRIHGERDRDRERAREEPEKRHREESEQMKRGTTSSHKDKDNRKDRKVKTSAVYVCGFVISCLINGLLICVRFV